MLLRAALLALAAASLALGLAGSDGTGGRASGTSEGERVRGPVRVIDADTFDVGAARVRLHGVDAPEDDQSCLDASGRAFACGDVATAFARARWEGREAACEILDRDRYGRGVARCRVAGEDAGAVLVGRGYAYAYLDYSRDYAEEEARARAARVGFFAGRFAAPWDHRRGNGGEAAPVVPASAPEGCAIKGNVSGGGRIYHVPGARDYDRTAIDEAAGERWFCSEAEALAAGWRAPR